MTLKPEHLTVLQKNIPDFDLFYKKISDGDISRYNDLDLGDKLEYRTWEDDYNFGYRHCLIIHQEGENEIPTKEFTVHAPNWRPESSPELIDVLFETLACYLLGGGKL